MGDSWDDDDDFLPDDGPSTVDQNNGKEPWVMLVVDDEVGIHEVTKIALQRFSFEARPLEIISAFSGAEAIEILESRGDIAVILLDVVMENDHAGLDCARKIREDLGIENTRIILRTGQPGMAPEQDVILAYDINDYRAKTELTSERLFTTVISALRGYRDILALSQYREDAYNLLAQNTSAIQSLIDLTEAPLFQLGTDLCLHRCNLAFANLLDSTVEKLVGLPLNEFAPDALFNALAHPKKKQRISIKNSEFVLTITDNGTSFSAMLKIG